MFITNIKTKRLKLKVLDESFSEKVLDFYVKNRDFLRKWDPLRNDEFYTTEYHKNNLNMEFDKIRNGLMVKFWLFKDGCNNPAGYICFDNIIRGVFQSCHLGYKMDKDEINKGYITEALEAGIGFIFKELRLHRIEANIMPENIPSIKVAEKLGFYNEGMSKKYLRINGKWEDHIHMVLLNDDIV